MSDICTPFSVSIAVDPHLHYPALKDAMRTAYSGTCVAYFQHGLVDLILTDAEWHSLPGNAAAPNAAGILVHPPRPTNIRPQPLAANAAAPAIALYNREVERFETITDRTAALKQRALLSFGPDHCLTVADPVFGTTYLSVRDMLDILDPLYGVASASTILTWKATLTRSIAPTDSVEHVLARHRAVHNQLLRAGQPLSEFDKLDILHQTFAPLPAILGIIAAYKIGAPALADQTFARLSTYILAQAPNIVATTGSHGYAAAALPALDIPALIAAAVQAHVSSMPRRGGRKHRAPPSPAPPDVPRQPHSYCWTHGTGFHSSAECRHPHPTLHQAGATAVNKLGGRA